MTRYFAWFGLNGGFVLTSLLSLYALALAAVFPSAARWLCAAAMLCSSVGDVFLMHFPSIERRFPQYFVIGAAAFMAAHLLYTACFALKIRALGASYVNGGMVLALAISLLCLAAFLVSCKHREQLPLALIYLLVITVNCMTVFSFARASMTLPALLAAAGALSFFASDLIIGLDLLLGVRRFGYLIWWLYPIGQALLITGVGVR